MQFIIYGCGTRGKMLLSCLNKTQVIAFIDSNPALIGIEHKGIKVISLQDYRRNYQDCFVIISSTIFHDEIVATLECNGIRRYFSLLRCPNELPAYEQPLPFHEMLKGIAPLELQQRVVLVGVNLFSVLLYDYLASHGIHVYFADLPEQGRIIQEIKNRETTYDFIPVEEAFKHNVRFLLTDRFIDKNRRHNLPHAECFYRFPRLPSYRYRDMSRFQDLHKGSRCFIVGNGPSLQMADLEKLRVNHEISFGVNQVHKAFEYTKWRPDYYCAADTYVVKSFVKQIGAFKGKYKFIGNRCATSFAGIDDDNLFFYPFLFEYYEDEGPDFSENPNEGILFGNTVIYDCLQFAVYMGFKEIYLIGTDCNYQNQGGEGDYFIKDYNDSTKHPSNFLADKVFIAYRKAREYADAHGIKIYNATRGGKLEVFERVDFDSLF